MAAMPSSSAAVANARRGAASTFGPDTVWAGCHARHVKKLGIGLIVVVGLIVSVGVAFSIYANTEYTTCYGIFTSQRAAENAADDARATGLDAYVDHRPTESAVQFETGETGDDARDDRKTFREIVAREHGRLGR